MANLIFSVFERCQISATSYEKIVLMQINRFHERGGEAWKRDIYRHKHLTIQLNTNQKVVLCVTNKSEQSKYI